MLKQRLAWAVIGTALLSFPALAQSNPPAKPSAPAATTNTGQWITQERTGQWRASKLKGLNIYNNNNEKIGDVNELILDQSGKIDAVVVGVGGFLGIGEHDVAIPFSEIKWVDQPRTSDRVASTPANRPADPNAPRATDPNAPLTTGTVATTDRTAARAYPDHGLLNMSKDQLKAAPAFKYAR